MNWEEFKIFVKGKTFLVGICFFDSDNKILEQYQTSGIIEELTDTGQLILKRNDGSLFPLPYDKNAIKKAKKGEYTEHTTGMVIIDPDFIMTGDVEVKDPLNVELIKKHGFIPVFPKS